MKTKKVNPRNKRMFHGLKKTKRSINVEGKWKAVELDPSLFAEEGMEGLVCFEELTNYSMLDSEKMANDVEKQPKKNKKAKKRKSTGEEEAVVKVDAESKEADETVEPAKKKAKKKNKSKTKKLNSEESDLQDDTSAKDKTQDGVDKSEAEGKNQATHEDIVKCVNSTISEPDASPKPSKRSKKRKKSEKGTVTVEGSNCESHSEHQDVIKDKMPKPVKRQQKNWTEVVLDGCNDRKTDVSAWKDLFVPAPVLKALSSLGFGSPTPIQALTLPSAIRDHKDILGAAETGSGKTLAFGIPMIHTILEWKKNSAELVEDNIEATIPMKSLYLPEPTASENYSVEEEVIKDAETESEDMTKEEENAAGSFSQPLLGLVLTPTRELAVQVKHHIDAVSKFTDIKTAIVVGGLSQEKQRRMLKLRPEIIIATPGRLWDLIKEKHPHLQNLRQVRCLVIDEADRMVERGHFAELENLLEMLKTAHFNPLRQMFVFSATLTTKHSLPTRLLQKRSLDQRSRLEILIDKVGIKAKPKIVDLTRKEATVETLTETCIQCQKEEKDFYLYYFLLRYPGRTMVFANSIDCIKRLNSLLVILDCDTLPLHANMHQKQRLKNLERFAERDRCVLLTTDVAARGLDIPNVQHVIHYQVPRTSETYVHRSGRTARATKEGLSLLLIGPDDMMNFKKIYRTLGKDEELPMFPIETKCMEAIKERVNLARQIEKVEFHNSRKKHHNSWLKQAAEDMEIDLDDDLLIGKGNDEEQDREQKMMVKGMKKHLKHLISQPVFKSTMKTKYPTQMGKLLLPHTTLTGRKNALSMVSMQEKKKLNKLVSSQQQKKGKKQK